MLAILVMALASCAGKWVLLSVQQLHAAQCVIIGALDYACAVHSDSNCRHDLPILAEWANPL
jgi:hypothetical protein